MSSYSLLWPMTGGRVFLCQICLWNRCRKPLNPIGGQRAQPIHDRGWWAASMLKHLYMRGWDAQQAPISSNQQHLSLTMIWVSSQWNLHQCRYKGVRKFPVNFLNQFGRSSEVTVDDSVGKKTDVSSCERLSGMPFFLGGGGGCVHPLESPRALLLTSNVSRLQFGAWR